MKCPNCDGKGTVLKIIYEDWQKDEIVRSAVKCPRCNGSGEVPMTNEEWLHTLNTEQFAEYVLNVWMDGAFNVNAEFGLNEAQIERHKGYIVEWLKEKHHAE